MRLTGLTLVAAFTSVGCLDAFVGSRDHDRDCWAMTVEVPTCEPGVEQIEPRFDPFLGFDKRYFNAHVQGATVASLSGASMVLDGPWDMPITFTWFEPLGDLFTVGDEVELSGGHWNLVKGPRGSVAHAHLGAFSSYSPGQVGEYGPDVEIFPACRRGQSGPVWGVAATLGDETVSISQGERGSVAGWEVLHHGATSASGYTESTEEGCVVMEGSFHGAVSAWTALPPPAP